MVSKHYSGNEGNNVPLPESKREYTSVIWRVVLNFESASLALVDAACLDQVSLPGGTIKR